MSKDQQGQLFIISGRSGSGKSTALKVMEDHGYNCIDNFPAGMIPALIVQMQKSETPGPGHAISIDARNLQSDIERFRQWHHMIQQAGIPCRVLFLDASDDRLLTRFSETRRRHPLTRQGITLPEALELETQLLDPIRQCADFELDTTNSTLYEIRDRVIDVLVQDKHNMVLTLQSFGFKHGLPGSTDFVFDVRALPNPYWEPALKTISGQTAPVQAWLGSQAAVGQMLDDLETFLIHWVPAFTLNNRSYLTVSIGCTGGFHRSVYIVEQLSQRLSCLGSPILVRHRELKS
jgi:UPF0042 nucleotide-binding protein